MAMLAQRCAGSACMVPCIGVLKGSDYKLQTATDEHRKKITMLSEWQVSNSSYARAFGEPPNPRNQLVQT
jgi:hypothetical protein